MAIKISIELPDWCDERDIFILAGLELAAYKRAKETSIFIKENRCSQCGKCCMDVPIDHEYGRAKDGNCVNLFYDETIKKYICKKGVYKPVSCCIGDKMIPECSITYKEQ
jgi:hypothetical protein